MTLLFFSNLFPTTAEPYRGLDNATLLHSLEPEFKTRVLSPRPLLPWARANFSARPEDAPFEPRWIPAAYLPKIGGAINHRLMARSLRRAFEQTLREFRPRAILSSWIFPDSCAALALAGGRVPVVAIAQGSDVHQYLAMPARRHVILDQLPRAAAVITRSRELSRLLSEAGISPAKLHTIYNGVDLETFQPRDKGAARRELSLPEKARIILFVGNFYDVKNPLLLIEAVARMAAADSVLVMAGAGPLEQPCRELASRLQLGSRVIFAGRTNPAGIARLMNAADILALPSKNEGVPNVILEAFASGLPVVASKVGGIPEILYNDALGRLVEPGSLISLAAAMDDQLARPRETAAIRRHGETFSWSATAANYRTVLRAALSSRIPGSKTQILNPIPLLYHFRTRGTGAEAVHISGIVRAFEKLGCQVVLSSPTGVDPRQTAGSTPFAEPRSGKGRGLARLSRFLPRFAFELLEFLYNFPAYYRNLRLARSHRCAFIYERHAFFLFSTALVARRLRCPLIVEVNELVGDSRVRAQPVFAGLARWTDRFVFRRARLIVVVSPHLKRRVQEYGIPADRILVLPNAVSEEELSSPAAPFAFIIESSPEGKPFILGFLGWLVEWHRLDFLIEALAAPQFAPVALVIIGEGPLQSALETQARSLGVRIHFAGPLPHASVPAALRGMDACVVPHSNEYRSPIKLFEFMAQERPVLAPRTEAIESVVHDGEDALLFTPLDIPSFRSALGKLFDSPALRESLGRNARRLVEQSHTWEKNAQKILAALE